MTFPSDTFEEAVDLSITASNQLHTILNGDSTTEVTVEDGSKIPSVRKAMVDSLYFKPPIAWAQGAYEDTYNQLREFVDGDVRTWWFAKGATVSTPVLMSTNPITDVNWTLWSAVTLNAATYETQKRLAAESGLNMVGSFLLGGTVTNVGDVVFYETDGKYYGWGGTLPKTIPAGSTPSTAGGIGALLWVDRTDILLRADITANGTSIDDLSRLNTTVGASKVKTATGATVQDYLSEGYNIVNVDHPPYNGDLVAAYNAIPSDGCCALLLGLKAYDISSLFSNTSRNVKPNIVLLGAGMPAVDYPNRKLVVGSGTILYGALYNSAIGFKAYNIGIDCGDWARANYFGGAYKDAFVMVDFPRYSDISFGNLRILESDVVNGNSASNTHCHLVQNGGEVYHGFLELIGGYHGYVNKALNMTGTTVLAWGQAGTHAIFKSDAAALCQWGHLDCLDIGKDGVTAMCSGILFEANTQQLGSISINTLKTRNTSFVLAQAATTDSFISGVHIGELIAGNVLGGLGATAAVSVGNKMVGFSIGRHDIEQSALPGIEVRSGAIQTDIGFGRVKNCTGHGYAFNAMTKHGNIWSISNTGYGVYNNGNSLLNAQDVYCAGNTSGGINQVPVVPITLQNSWIDGYGTFRAARYGSTVKISGLLSGGAVGTGYTWQTVAILANYYPVFDEYISASGYIGSGASVGLLAKVTSTGLVQVYGMGAISVVGVTLNGSYTIQSNQ